MMKYDLDKKPTRGAQRTLLAFSQTMFQLLAQKPFEKKSTLMRSASYVIFPERLFIITLTINTTSSITAGTC